MHNKGVNHNRFHIMRMKCVNSKRFTFLKNKKGIEQNLNHCRKLYVLYREFCTLAKIFSTRLKKVVNFPLKIFKIVPTFALPNY